MEARVYERTRVHGKSSQSSWGQTPRSLDQTIGDHGAVIDGVASQLPDGFPEDIATPIFDGIKRCVRKLSAAW